MHIYYFSPIVLDSRSVIQVRLERVIDCGSDLNCALYDVLWPACAAKKARIEKQEAREREREEAARKLQEEQEAAAATEGEGSSDSTTQFPQSSLSWNGRCLHVYVHMSSLGNPDCAAWVHTHVCPNTRAERGLLPAA